MNKKILTITLIFFIPTFTLFAKDLIVLDFPRTYNLNPLLADYNSDAQVLNGLYEGLFTIDSASPEPTPAIAKGYKISRNRKTWTFYIREDITFSNGTAITADDVKRSLLQTLNPKTKAPFASLLDCIEGASAYRTGIGNIEEVKIRVRNPTTVVITLENPVAHFAKILCHHSFSIVPKENNVYSGAYILEKQTPEETVLIKNTAYREAKNVSIERIIFRAIEDPSEAAWLLNTGKAQWITGNALIDDIYTQENIKIAAQFGTEFLFFMANRDPWNDPKLRNAVMTAIPWENLRAGNMIIATTLILPLSEYPNIYGITDYDPELAIEMFEDAGYSKEDNLKLKFCIPDYDSAMKKATIIKQALEPLGITVIIDTVEPQRYINSFSSEAADLYTYTWIGDFADPLSFLELFRKDSSLRETAWTNENFEKILIEASKISESEQRYKKLSEAEQLLLDEGLILPISHPVSFHAIDTQILGGWFSNVLDIHPLKDLYFTNPPALQNFVKGKSFDHNEDLWYNAGL